MTVAASAWNAIDACKKDEARVCEYLDHMQLCAQGLNAKDHAATGWFGDHGKASDGNGDDEYGTWNRNFCTSNCDGVAQHGHESKAYSCCRGPSVTRTATTGTCPPETSAMRTTGGDVCASAMQSENDMHSAIDTCRKMKAHVCSHGDFFQLGATNPWGDVSVGWYGDHGYATGGNIDDEYVLLWWEFWWWAGGWWR